MRKIGLFLIIVVLLAVVQETEQQECSRTHCSGRNGYKRCSCGCHNCCKRKHGCQGGFCKRFRPPIGRKCFCFGCIGFAASKSAVTKDSKAA